MKAPDNYGVKLKWLLSTPSIFELQNDIFLKRELMIHKIQIQGAKSDFAGEKIDHT